MGTFPLPDHAALGGTPPDWPILLADGRGVRQPAHDMGYEAAELVTDLVRGCSDRPEPEIHASVQIRESVVPLRRS